MKFLVDAPLGGLAKWLRFCGFDVELRPLPLGKAPRLPEPVAERFILTAQAALGRLGRADVVVLAGTTPEAQLREVCQRLHLKRQDLEPLSRCPRCNRELTPLPRDRARGQVPDHVFTAQREFYQCPGCGRIFWPGSHTLAIVAQLDRIFGGRRQSTSRTGTSLSAGDPHEH